MDARSRLEVSLEVEGIADSVTMGCLPLAALPSPADVSDDSRLVLPRVVSMPAAVAVDEEDASGAGPWRSMARRIIVVAHLLEDERR